MIQRILMAATASASFLTVFAAAQAAEPPQAYIRHCKVCHQQAGQGVSTTFPRIAGRAAKIASSETGRVHLAQVLLYGQFGPIEVDEKTYRGLMAAFARLEDEELADILNYIVSLDGPESKGLDIDPYDAEEVAEIRGGEKLSARKVYDQRKAMKDDGLIP